MAFSAEEKDEIKAMVLTEIEKMFAELAHKYGTKENHEKMLFLLDIESSIKQGLMDAEESEQSKSA
ncbi:MAG: hypothetical protein LH614_00740 [Pyrinomonadaceae bacterium]|nr:hypothetical protein [Pyrinomonadaceae bacterium]